ncbi:MAG: hypothetical protein AAF682_05650 [Planctomycetota bacterium]
MTTSFFPASLSFGLLAFAPVAAAQTLYGVDGPAGLAREFPSAAGGACPQPNPFQSSWDFTAIPNCGPLPLAFGGPPSLAGDLAIDKANDNVYLTDGSIIASYEAGDATAGIAPGQRLEGFVPSVLLTGNPPFPGPLTGLGAVGSLGAVPTLGNPPNLLCTNAQTNPWYIASITPPNPTCSGGGGAFTTGFLASNPLQVNGLPAGTGVFTDVTYDPTANMLWVCDSNGWVHRISTFGAALASTQVTAAGTCGLTAPLTGIAFDTATPSVITGGPGALYVTDGTNVAYLDVNALAAGPTFYTPTTCTPTAAPISGLAYTAHSINYGTPGGLPTISTVGQSTSPSLNHKVTLTNAPAGQFMYLFYGSNTGAPLGYHCPPQPAGSGQSLYVDIALPAGGSIFLGPTPGGAGTFAVSATLPPGIPVGSSLFVQVFFVSPPPGPVLATEGAEFTISRQF